MCEAIVIIPARYESSRLPGKPILPEIKEFTGKYLIQHVYENASEAENVQDVIVATDDERIVEVVEDFGGKARMTSGDHTCGTERIAEVAAGLRPEIVVNVQGDEPQIAPGQIEKVVGLLQEDEKTDMGTLAYPLTTEESWKDPNTVKVVTDQRGYALYFSRSAIPHVRDSEKGIEDSPLKPLGHIGIYSYRRNFLIQFSQTSTCQLERTEKLEQLRALYGGHKIKVGITKNAPIGIDTREDLEKWFSGY